MLSLAAFMKNNCYNQYESTKFDKNLDNKARVITKN